MQTKKPIGQKEPEEMKMRREWGVVILNKFMIFFEDFLFCLGLFYLVFQYLYEKPSVVGLALGDFYISPS
jgi:hypothetical protein